MDAAVAAHGPWRAYGSLVAWFALNIAMVLSNKVLFRSFGFTFPVSLTVVHMATCGLCAWAVTRLAGGGGSSGGSGEIGPDEASVDQADDDVSRVDRDRSPAKPFAPQVSLSFGFWLARVVPLACLFASNIVLGNVALRFIPVSFFQTIKSIVPAMSVGLAWAFQGKVESGLVYVSLVPVVFGVAIASFSEINFELVGFAAYILSRVINASQVIVAGRLLGSTRLDGVSVLIYMAPPAAAILAPVAYFTEWGRLSVEWEHFGTAFGAMLLLASGLCAFALNVASFFAVQYHTALTFCVVGNAKSVLNIVLSVALFGNEISFVNGVGCAVTIAGVVWYNEVKRRQDETNKDDTSKSD